MARRRRRRRDLVEDAVGVADLGSLVWQVVTLPFKVVRAVLDVFT